MESQTAYVSQPAGAIRHLAPELVRRKLDEADRTVKGGADRAHLLGLAHRFRSREHIIPADVPIFGERAAMSRSSIGAVSAEPYGQRTTSHSRV
jgi:hypothetical protein